MKKLRKRLWLWLFVLCLTGCGSADPEEHFSSTIQEDATVYQAQSGEEATKVYQSQAKKTQETAIKSIQSSDDASQETIDAEKKTNSVKEADVNATDTASAGTATEGIESEAAKAEEAIPEVQELTDQELRRLQWSIRSTDNGFFICHYYRPEEIDWQTVLQGGAGMKVTLSDEQVAVVRESLRTERLEEKQRIAELRGEDLMMELEEGEEPPEEPFTEEELALNASQVTALTNRSVQNFVKSRTGLDYSEARHPLEWKALDRNLIYYVPKQLETMRVEFMSATVCDNVYEIYYRKAGWAREKKAEYVMTVKVEKGKWTFISNLPLEQARPKTLADIEYVTSKELARLQGTKELIEVPELPKEEEYEEEVVTSSKKNAPKEPTYYWAIITAAQDQTEISVERLYQGDLITEGLLKDRYYIPGESIATVTLDAGEKVGVKVTLEDIPKLRIQVISGSYYGAYAFGEENRLKRFTKEGFPLSTYVYGRDYAGEQRGPEYQNEAGLLRFLEGTWLFYDGAEGEYTAKLTISNKGAITIETLTEIYYMEIYGYDRLYTDSRSDPPDVIRIRSTNEETLDIFTKHYPFLKTKVGDYRVKAIQKDGVQLLMLSFENKGKDGLSYLLPCADLLADEIVLYRFIGASGEDGNEGKG